MFFGSLYGAYAFNSYFSLQTGLTITLNNGLHLSESIESISHGGREDFDARYAALDIPILPSLTLRPFQSVLRSLFFRICAGPYISIAISNMEIINGWNNVTLDLPIINKMVFGILGDVGIGYSIGQGNIVFDVRYLSDLSPRSVDSNMGWGERDALTRRGLVLLLGYEYWF